MASRSWNRVELIGNLTRDPELRYTPNGAAVCTFGMATNRTYVTEGERKEEADFHRLVAWNKLAELCNQLLKKGNRVFVSGRLQTRSWEGQDGQTRNVTEIVIEDMILLTPKSNGDYTPVPEDVGVEPVKVKESKESEEPEESKAEKKTEIQKEEPKEKEEPKTESFDSAQDKKAAPKEEVEDDLPF
ncbi:single-stranded DNA-binding protein [Candidatus Daviesbacteria bacterium]|nr:single-stranded DNA-binding protein [Candidatus Daviesbacteria bacterium]